MTEPVFARASAQDPLFLLGLSGTPPGYTIAFLPSTAVSGTSLTLSATWLSSPGIYLFLGSAIADETAFAGAVQLYAGSQPIRFLWITNPNAPASEWIASSIQVTQTPGAATGVLTRTAQFPLNNYLLGIASGSQIGLDTNNDGFSVEGTQGPPSIYLLSGSGQYRFSSTGTLALPFAGDQAGCLEFALPLPEPVAGQPTALDELDVCCRLFIDDTSSSPPMFLRSIRYPVIDLSEGAFTLYPSIDPVLPLDPSRTAFFFVPPGSVSPQQPIMSAYRTVYGQKVLFTPEVTESAPAGPSLVFALNTQLLSVNDADPYYLTFAGSFGLSIDGVTGSGAARVMCGISGLEYAGTTTAPAAAIVFTPGQAAYAPGFWNAGGESGIDDQPALADLGTTAWAYLAAAEEGTLAYFAQPRDATIYQAEDLQPQSQDEEDLLFYLEVFAGTFPSTIGSPAPAAFPMLPYALLAADDVPDARRLESEIVSRARRALLDSILLPTESGTPSGTRLGATPQGLLLQFDQSLAFWEQLTIAQLTGGTQILALQNITDGLKSALQSNELFAVVSDPTVFLASCAPVAPFTLVIDGWTFDLNPGSWSEANTIFVFKYGAKSIDELARDTSIWSWQEAADGFGGGTTIADVQQQLVAMIDDAKDRAASGDPDFENFAEIVQNPRWNGVLFLRVALGTNAFPPDLLGLVAGLQQPLYAHHLGVNLAAVHNHDGVLEQQDASMFGLINYNDPVDLTFDNTDYAYKVLAIKALFTNSALTRFSSLIEVMLNRLFGAISSMIGGLHFNNILLNGTMQRQNGVATYLFSEQGRNLYKIMSSALDLVEITSAQFVTLRSDTVSGLVETRFDFSGVLRFQPFPDFDIFSFGNVYENKIQTFTGGLVFSNLALHMSFVLDASPIEQTFVFDAGSLAFDLSHSRARPDSLFQHFPLTLADLLQATPNSQPGDLGLMSVRTPLPASKMLPPWYALRFQLDLGTLGALAADAGLIVSLAACWGASGGDPAIYIGLKLPGSSSSRPEIPIEGVLKLSFGGIEFTVDRSDAGVGYILRLKNIALKLLSLSFPPGQTNLYLFGDPSGGRSGVLGWYAAYQKSGDDKKKSDLVRGSRITAARPRMLQSGEE